MEEATEEPEKDSKSDLEKAEEEHSLIISNIMLVWSHLFIVICFH